MSAILDSLDDIYCLQESLPQERAHLLLLLEDAQLHALLEVSLKLGAHVARHLATMRPELIADVCESVATPGVDHAHAELVARGTAPWAPPGASSGSVSDGTQ